MLDEFLRNELSLNREAGTYLFYGDDLEKNLAIALDFAGELFSRNSSAEEREKTFSQMIELALETAIKI